MAFVSWASSALKVETDPRFDSWSTEVLKRHIVKNRSYIDLNDLV